MRRRTILYVAFMIGLILLIIYFLTNPNVTEVKMYRFTLRAGEGGTIPAGLARIISGEYYEGAEIKVVARNHPGYGFLNWSSSDGGTFDDPTNSESIFSMPPNDVVVTANFYPLRNSDA